MSGRRAVILAAGMGRRLHGGTSRPKCLELVGGCSILERQVAALAAADAREITVVVGYRAAMVREACEGFALRHGVAVAFVENEAFARTNTLYSMYLARHAFEADCFVLNGDVVIPRSLPARLAGAHGAAVLAIDVRACGEEEVKAVVVEGRVRWLAKDVDPAGALGEFIGVAFVRAEAGARFAHHLAHAVELEHRRDAYFEHALSRVAGERELAAYPLHGEPVIEIDFPDDLRRARLDIAPRLEPVPASEVDA